jgi:hypothetical protein
VAGTAIDTSAAGPPGGVGPYPLGIGVEFLDDARTRVLVVRAQPPIDPGVSRAGSTTAAVRYFSHVELSSSGRVKSRSGHTVRARFVNLAVTVTNTSRAVLRVVITGGAIDAGGTSFPTAARQEVTYQGPLGRLPDWTAEIGPAVAPGKSVTEYLTFAVPIDDRIAVFEVDPRRETSGTSVTSLNPLSVMFTSR